LTGAGLALVVGVGCWRKGGLKPLSSKTAKSGKNEQLPAYQHLPLPFIQHFVGIFGLRVATC
jgi:hypothetical protein